MYFSECLRFANEFLSIVYFPSNVILNRGDGMGVQNRAMSVRMSLPDSMLRYQRMKNRKILFQSIWYNHFRCLLYCVIRTMVGQHIRS